MTRRYIFLFIYYKRKKKRKEDPAVTIYFTVYHMLANDRTTVHSVHRDSGQGFDSAPVETHTSETNNVSQREGFTRAQGRWFTASL